MFDVSNYEGPKFWSFQRSEPPHERGGVVEEYFKPSLYPSLIPGEKGQDHGEYGGPGDRDDVDDEGEGDGEREQWWSTGRRDETC